MRIKICAVCKMEKNFCICQKKIRDYLIPLGLK